MDEPLMQVYRAMVRARAFDRRAIALQRVGRLGTFAPCTGQEIVGAAVGVAMARQDILVPGYRETAAWLARGVPAERLMAWWGGDPRGLDWRDLDLDDLPPAIPIGTWVAHAVGVAWAERLAESDRAVVTMIGDGGMNRGDVMESLNLAALHRLPLLVVVNDNGWAISTPAATHSATPADVRASGFGIPADVVDARRPDRVVETVVAAVRRVRFAGPLLVRVCTARLAPHTTADDPTRYRDRDEMERERQEADPLPILRELLIRRGLLDDGGCAAIEAEARAEMEAAAERWLAMEPPDPILPWRYLYATPHHPTLVRNGVDPEMLS